MKPNDNKQEAADKLRLQVFLSRAGVCSRRKAMDVIKEGRVKVNGQVVTEPSTPVRPQEDAVLYQGKVVRFKTYEYIMLFKPKDYVTTKAQGLNERSVMTLLPADKQHLSPVGRLDKDTEGLLLLTNDGDFAQALSHPRYNVNKTYEVVVRGEILPADVRRLETGVVLEGKKTAPARIQKTRVHKDHTTFLMTIHEGRKRQVRLMCQAVGHHVVALKRVEQGPFQLGTLKEGQWAVMSPARMRTLQQFLTRS